MIDHLFEFYWFVSIILLMVGAFVAFFADIDPSSPHPFEEFPLVKSWFAWWTMITFSSWVGIEFIWIMNTIFPNVADVFNWVFRLIPGIFLFFTAADYLERIGKMKLP